MRSRRNHTALLQPPTPEFDSATTNDDQALDDIHGASLEIQASLGLQELLFFNKYFFVVYILLITIVSYSHGAIGGLFGGTTEMIFYSFLFVIEPGRLSIGYFGNLGQRTTVLAGFGLLSFFLCFPCVALLCLQSPTPMELTMNVMQACFLLGETGFACIAFNRISQHDSSRLHLLTLMGYYSDTGSSTGLMETTI
eukprot:m.110696 g.110696  ORF g.110696 m.110696 type:complete len:196 (+) comp28061_c1_seq2:147-734(+)